MRRRWLLLGCAGVVWLGACGAGDEEMSTACTDAAQVRTALQDAPGDVALADGTRLSACVTDATTPALLQDLGFTFTAIAEDLERSARHDPTVAARLGFLIGAARRGSDRGSGQGAELAHRLERTGAEIADADAAAALQQGLRAGEDAG